MNKVNILVVDDRPEGILAVQAVLSSPSYNIVTAASGNEALRHLLTLDFAVILMDVQMPIMNGFETASVIKTREKSKDIPIIFMSAINQDEQYVYQGYGVGAIDYLLKPFDPYILRSKVAIFVDIYRKNHLIKEQAQKLRENEARVYAQKMDELEIENLRRYQYLADSIPQIVFRVSSEGNYKYFNKVWFEYTGLDINYSSEDSWKNVIHPSDIIHLNNILSSASDSDSSECECRILNRHGQFRWHLIRVQPEDQAWLGTATDIEDRKKAEETQKFLSDAGELLIETLDYSLILKSIAKFVVPHLADWISFETVDADGNLEHVVIYHRDAKKLPEIDKFYRTEYRDGENSKLKQVLTTGKKLILNEQTVENHNTLIFPLCLHNRTIGIMTLSSLGRKFEDTAISLSDELSRRVAFALENARLYKLSQEAIEVRNDFLSIASHELNTPITSLKLQLQMVKKSLLLASEGTFPLERFSKGVDASCKQVDRLINLIQILLDVTRIQSGKFTFSFEKFNVQDIVKEVIDRHKEIIDASDCKVKVSNEVSAEVLWDKTRIEQVVTNLLTNAIKYAPGEIEITVSDIGENIAILVRDHGRGIPETKLKTIFDRFERATSNESVSGLGLGLFIVKQIIDGHQGKIEVKSEQEKGTTFCVFIPKAGPKIIPVGTLEENQLH